MVVPNSKYEKCHGSVKNRAYLAAVDVDEEASLDSVDLSGFEIPRYQELKYLRLEELEE